MIKVLKYDYFLVAFKITLLLASKVAPYYETSSLIQHYADLVCFIFIRFIHVKNEGYSKIMI